MTNPPKPPPSKPAPKSAREDKIDKQVEGTFPASDPPSYAGGNHTIGAPEGRESQAPKPGDANVKDAQKKVHTQKSGLPDKPG
jgi:hypothetical protein